jgi:chromosome segregation ATPase
METLQKDIQSIGLQVGAVQDKQGHIELAMAERFERVDRQQGQFHDWTQDQDARLVDLGMNFDQQQQELASNRAQLMELQEGITAGFAGLQDEQSNVNSQQQAILALSQAHQGQLEQITLDMEQQHSDINTLNTQTESISGRVDAVHDHQEHMEQTTTERLGNIDQQQSRFYEWAQGQDERMANLDAQIKQHQQDLTATLNQLQELSNGVTVGFDGMQQQQTDLYTLHQAVWESLRGQQEQLEQAAQTIQALQDNEQANITALQANIQSIVSQMQGLQERHEHMKESLSEGLQRIDSQQGQLVDWTQTQDTRLDQLNTEIKHHQEEYVETLEGMTSRLTDLQTVQAGLHETMQTYHQALRQFLDMLGQQLQQQKTRVDTLTRQMEQVQEHLVSLEGQTTRLDQDMERAWKDMSETLTSQRQIQNQAGLDMEVYLESMGGALSRIKAIQETLQRQLQQMDTRMTATQKMTAETLADIQNQLERTLRKPDTLYSPQDAFSETVK